MPAASFRRFFPCALACGVLGLSLACKDPVLEEIEFPPVPTEPNLPALFIAHDVDILFVIDDSSSMGEEQQALAADIATLVEVLERPEVAANYRIGITTTDDGNPACGGSTPEQGALQLQSCSGRVDEFGTAPEACTAGCPAAWADIDTLPSAAEGVDGLAPRRWLENDEGRTNLPEGLGMTQALQCVLPQGTSGCGFESPLEAMWKAIRRWRTDTDPDQGFLRSRSVLSIVHVTDGDDCSYNPDFEAIFSPDGERVFWSDPTAEAPTSATCWNAGVACEGSSPYADCSTVNVDIDGNEVTAADAEDLAVIRPMARYIDQLQAIELDKQSITPDQQVLVSIIGGVGPDGEVTYQDAAVDPTFQQDFGIGPGCDGASGPAVPPVRLRELAEAFQVGDQPNMFSACNDDYAPALTAIGEAIAAQIRPACIPACVADVDPSTADVLDPSCSITQESPNGDGSFDQLDVPPCEAGDALPSGLDVCYVALTEDARSEFCADAGFNLELRFVRREGVRPPEGTAILVGCDLSDDKALDCPELP